ncbi:CPBP family intramembrane metalloprotease [Microbacterium sp. Sa4CUA7]|uniref:CPBP family intramembrane metalloprotease n=1 Tax=Microbacterium pullorum TaxID=2762236 RepID=A0ABR8S1M9_9MICO|nr:CPBP family intramembrane glutamic endopeptidase [Microbacterium pullorum]MBD7957380.1 CPBP family intramembrane metalloprotease [Microbacterium pullorum]
MRTLQDTKPIWHALIWVVIYIVSVNIGDYVGEVIAFPAMTSVVLMVLSVVLLVYLRVGRRLAFYGVRRVMSGTLPRTLFYVPLFAIAFVQYFTGFASDLDWQTVVSVVLLVVAVGFIEELLFRGFLLQALRTRGGVTRAIIISGVTFGFGHLVNLLRGYSIPDQALQLVGAVLIGIALAYCVVLTGSILPGVVFHVLFNLSGALTAHSVLGDSITIGIVAVVMIPYILFLRNRLAKAGPAVPTSADPERSVAETVRTP